MGCGFWIQIFTSTRIRIWIRIQVTKSMDPDQAFPSHIRYRCQIQKRRSSFEQAEDQFFLLLFVNSYSWIRIRIPYTDQDPSEVHQCGPMPVRIQIQTLAMIEALTIPACYCSSLGSNPNISHKNTKWAA